MAYFEAYRIHINIVMSYEVVQLNILLFFCFVADCLAHFSVLLIDLFLSINFSRYNFVSTHQIMLQIKNFLH